MTSLFIAVSALALRNAAVWQAPASELVALPGGRAVPAERAAAGAVGLNGEGHSSSYEWSIDGTSPGHLALVLTPCVF
jgi:uncharacterized protein GlcG (DUF336 family)